MFHYKIKKQILVIGLICVSSLCLAQTTNQAAAPKTGFRTSDFTISYQSWLEKVELLQNQIQDNSYSQFYGIGFGISKTTTGRSNFGLRYAVDFLSGQTNTGGSQTLVTYQKSNVGWLGLRTEVLGSYLISPEIILSVGPTFLYRKINWPESDSLNIRSGAALNWGLIANVDYHLTSEWRLRQSLGTLATRATTIWGLGLGRKF